MKRIARLLFLCGAIALLPASAALGTCGIGTTIWEGDDGTAAKVLAFTTNFWTLKGLSTTSEISGCTESNNIFKSASTDAKVHDYASQNLDHLAVDIARGGGDYMAVLVHLLGVLGDHSSALRTLAQQNLETLFPHDHVTASQVLVTLGHLMGESDALSTYVTS